MCDPRRAIKMWPISSTTPGQRLRDQAIVIRLKMVSRRWSFGEHAIGQLAHSSLSYTFTYNVGVSKTAVKKLREIPRAADRFFDDREHLHRPAGKISRSAIGVWTSDQEAISLSASALSLRLS